MMDDTLLERAVATKPPARWRNLWSCEKPISTQRNGAIGPGEFWGSEWFPTKADAEDSAPHPRLTGGDPV